MLDGDFGGPNQFRRMEGLINFDFDKLNSLTGEKAVEYFRKYAPLTTNARETLINWYEKGLLEKLNLPHFLMYRGTINSPFYERKLGIEDLLVDAGDNLKILFGLLHTFSYPLLKTTSEQIKSTVSSVYSLPASRIIADTAPGINHGSLYIFSEADIGYVIANLEIASAEQPMGFVEGVIAYRLQRDIKNLNALQKKRKEVEERHTKQLEIYRENTDGIIDKFKIHDPKKYIENIIDNNSKSKLEDHLFTLMKEMIEYSKVLYEKNQLPEPMKRSVIKTLQDDAVKFDEFEDLTPIGISLYKFLQNHGEQPFVKNILKDIGSRIFFAINNVPHDSGESAEKVLSFVINYFQERYNVTINRVEGVPYIYSLEDSVMRQATNRGVPSYNYLSELGLKKFDSPITEAYYAQLKKLIKPVV